MESVYSLEIAQLQQSLKSKSLELAYEQSAHRVNMNHEHEEARQLRVRILLLEDENDDLYAQLTQDDDHIEELERCIEERREQLDEFEARLQYAQGESRAKTRELEVVKAELKSLNGVSTDSAKLLTEKLALSRELSSLRPELEHLRSEVASHRSLLSEKLSLQRQLSTIQVELETEKRATQRALAKEGKNHEKESKLANQLDDMRKDLARERREREKAEKEIRDTTSNLEAERRATQRAVAKEGKKLERDIELENQIESLRKDLSREKREREAIEKEAKHTSEEIKEQKDRMEGKLEAFRSKLRVTKERLKGCQAELQEAQAAASAQLRLGGSDDVKKLAKNPRKRSASQLERDAAIGTPGEIVPKKKAGKRTSTLPGDKSTFSITPFLNRTSVAPESPEQVQSSIAKCGEEQDTPVARSEAAQCLDTEFSPTVAQKTKSDKLQPGSRAAPKERILSIAKAGKGNIKAPAARKRTAAPTLDKVAEEEDEENADPKEASTRVPQDAAKAANLLTSTLGPSEDIEVKKKKRKLLGAGSSKTLFDEDDAENPKGPAKGLFSNKGIVAVGRGGLMGSKNNLRGGLGVAVGAFGSFSPLKRDRKSAA